MPRPIRRKNDVQEYSAITLSPAQRRRIRKDIDPDQLRPNRNDGCEQVSGWYETISKDIRKITTRAQADPERIEAILWPFIALFNFFALSLRENVHVPYMLDVPRCLEVSRQFVDIAVCIVLATVNAVTGPIHDVVEACYAVVGWGTKEEEASERVQLTFGEFIRLFTTNDIVFLFL